MKKTTLMMLILFTMTLQGQNKLLSSIEELGASVGRPTEQT